MPAGSGSERRQQVNTQLSVTRNPRVLIRESLPKVFAAPP
jgi:hypothetical protein